TLRHHAAPRPRAPRSQGNRRTHREANPCVALTCASGLDSLLVANWRQFRGLAPHRMAFQGSLAELHLPDIIQLISVSGKTGVFHLSDGNLKGEIFLNDGQIVHAQLEDAAGEEAVYALAIWSQGEFKFEPGIATQQRTISKSNTNLLMEAARRLDEWRVLSKKIPSVDLIPEFVVQENRERQINLNTSEWMILSQIDGYRSIKTSAATCRLSVFSA